MVMHFFLIKSIIDLMHKSFYASGFLYHPYTHQILLQQNNSLLNTASSWLLFEGLCAEKEGPESLFKTIILKLLGIKIDTVFPVYSYFNESTNKNQYIVYSKLRTLQNFSSKNGVAFSWFSFKEVIKMRIKEQTKHDIVVGQRVIEAAKRKSRGEHTFQ